MAQGRWVHITVKVEGDGEVVLPQADEVAAALRDKVENKRLKGVKWRITKVSF